MAAAGGTLGGEKRHRGAAEVNAPGPARAAGAARTLSDSDVFDALKARRSPADPEESQSVP